MTNVLVGIYNGNPEAGGISIANNTVNLNAYGSNTTTFYWKAQMGTTNIYALVNNNSAYKEWNYSNNEANDSITVSSWQFLYGDISANTSNYTLGNANLSGLRAWPASLFEGGNIFVTDAGANIYWPDLVALGQTASGGTPSNNNFATLDSLLNMTGYNDSVSNLYTTGGIPDNLTNFTIFNIPVDNVPVADSVNNSNFTTGILWDSAPPSLGGNDTDGQFDANDREDIVFVSQIHPNTRGTFGTYDYEIRVPARLRTYQTSTPSPGVIYVELK